MIVISVSKCRWFWALWQSAKALGFLDKNKKYRRDDLDILDNISFSKTHEKLHTSDSTISGSSLNFRQFVGLTFRALCTLTFTDLCYDGVENQPKIHSRRTILKRYIYVCVYIEDMYIYIHISSIYTYTPIYLLYIYTYIFFIYTYISSLYTYTHISFYIYIK